MLGDDGLVHQDVAASSNTAEPPSVSRYGTLSRVVVCADRVDSSVVFLLHIALEAPIAVMGLLSPLSLPFIQLTNTTLVLLKVRNLVLKPSAS